MHQHKVVAMAVKEAATVAKEDTVVKVATVAEVAMANKAVVMVTKAVTDLIVTNKTETNQQVVKPPVVVQEMMTELYLLVTLASTLKNKTSLAYSQRRD